MNGRDLIFHRVSRDEVEARGPEGMPVAYVRTDRERPRGPAVRYFVSFPDGELGAMFRVSDYANANRARADAERWIRGLWPS